MVEKNIIAGPVRDELRDFNRFLIESANLHLQFGNLDRADKSRLEGHRQRISSGEILPPGTGSYPSSIEEIAKMLTDGCSEHAAEYRLQKFWNALGATFYIGQINGDPTPEPNQGTEGEASNSDIAAPARERKASKDNPRMRAERRFLRAFLGPDRVASAAAESARRLLGPVNAEAVRKGLPEFALTRLHHRLKELPNVRD